MKLWTCTFLLGLFTTLAAETATEFTIRIEADHQQTFIGLGVSVSNRNKPGYAALPANMKRELADMLWDDSHARIARLWLPLDEFSPKPNVFSLGSFKRRYVESGYLEYAVKAGCEILLLAPSNIPPYLRDNPKSALYDKQKFNKNPESLQTYASILATALEMITKELKLPIHATGIQNEPSSRVKISPADFTTIVMHLDQELGKRSKQLQDIDIIGPECASVDSMCDSYVTALRANKKSWKALSGLSAHSYNMALKEPWASSWLKDGKAFWNTESGNTEVSAAGKPLPFCSHHGTSLAARCLNDLRRGCTHWIWFLGYEQAANNSGDSHRLIRWNGKKIEALPSFHYFRQIGQTITPKSRLLRVQSRPELKDWTSGRKERLYLAAAETEKGALAFAACNYSSATFADDPKSGTGFYKKNCGYSGKDLSLTIEIPRTYLSTGEKTVTVEKIGGEQLPLQERWKFPIEKIRIPIAGRKIQIMIKPMELVTFTID